MTYAASHGRRLLVATLAALLLAACTVPPTEAQAKTPTRAQASSLYEYAQTLANNALRRKHWASGTPRWCGWHGWDCIRVAAPVLKTGNGIYHWWGPSMWTGRCFWVCWSLKTWITAGRVNTWTGKVTIYGRR